MRPSQKPTFSQLVCSAALVRTAFTEHPPTRAWWRILLLLHGKPVSVSLFSQERGRRVAEGFLFYAKLYRFLAGLLALLALSLFWLSQDLGISWFYGGACLLAALFLESVSGLGRSGATEYANDRTQGTLALLTFLMGITTFLSAFVAAVSVVALRHVWLPPAINLVGTSVLLLLGVGSYLIEAVFLITESHTSPV